MVLEQLDNHMQKKKSQKQIWHHLQKWTQNDYRLKTIKLKKKKKLDNNIGENLDDPEHDNDFFRYNRHNPLKHF